MARVFLSYDREDGDRARSIAAALQKAGHTVWWDQHIKGGAQYSKEIEQALKDAEAVVVLWSAQSVESPWVRDEASAGRDGGRLVPVSLDRTEPPLGFRQFQTIDLSASRGRRLSSALRQLLGAVNALGDGTEGSPATTVIPAEARRRPSPRGMAAVLVVIVALVAAVLLWHPWTGTAVPVVAVRAADASDNSRALARELFVRLGAANSARTPSIQLVDENAHKTSDLILEVSHAGSAAEPSANLVLLRGRDRQLLASQDLAPAEGETADIRTSVAVAATSILECATAALGSRPQLPLDILKQYLSACIPFGSLYGMEDVSIILPQLEQIVRRQPNFLPARRQLLLAGAFLRAIPTDVAKPSPEWLRAQVAAARGIDPSLPEIRLAELELLPTTDFAGRIALVDNLHRDFPDDKFVLGARSEQLMLVGRNNEAVVGAERAARLDPLAPYSRSEYVRALAFSGRLPRAFEELKDYQPVSVVAMNFTDTRFRVHLRYGDSQPASKILQMYGTSKAHEAFLLARTEPTQQNRERAAAIARTVAAEHGFYSMLAEVLSAFGRNDETYEMLMRVEPAHLDQFTLQTLFRPMLGGIRRDPRFLRVAQRFGLVEYWRQSGKWPDFCNEPGLPYDCKKEAAKLTA